MPPHSNHVAREYWTPRWVVDALERRRGAPYAIDMAASGPKTLPIVVRREGREIVKGHCSVPANNVAPRYLTDSLSVDWARAITEAAGNGRMGAFCNPPWDRIADFLPRASDETLVDFLLPARLDAGWGAWVMGARRVTFLSPRVAYYDPIAECIRPGVSIGSMVVEYGPRLPGQVVPIMERVTLERRMPN